MSLHIEMEFHKYTNRDKYDDLLKCGTYFKKQNKITFSLNLVVFALQIVVMSFFLKISYFESANRKLFIKTSSYHGELFRSVTVWIPVSVAV